MAGDKLEVYYTADEQTDHVSVEYVIHEDGTYADKRTLPDEALLYGMYREDENTASGRGYPIYHLIALYSYNPRNAEA